MGRKELFRYDGFERGLLLQANDQGLCSSPKNDVDEVNPEPLQAMQSCIACNVTLIVYYLSPRRGRALNLGWPLIVSWSKESRLLAEVNGNGVPKCPRLGRRMDLFSYGVGFD